MRSTVFIALLIILFVGCSQENIQEKIDQPIIEKCELGYNISCIKAYITHRTIELEIQNNLDFDVKINEIKIYEAGTCGTERLDGERFPGLLKARSKGIIQLVCNTIPEAGKALISPIILRYKNPEDLILHTEKGNLTAQVH